MKLTRWMLPLAAACALALPSLPVLADAAGLRARYGELRDELRNNNYQRSLYIDSTEGANTLQGDVYAVLDHSFDKVSRGLKDANGWCDIMILPFNTKYCHAGEQQLTVRIGRKYNQPVEQAFKLNFALRNVATGSDYLETRLNAAQGPVGTRDYRIVVAAVPIDGGKTFLHLSYSYGYGAAGKFAMQAYLSTAGADKVGFSPSKESQGQLTGGVRGAVERNAMRYYLAIDAYLDALDAPAEQRAEKRIQTWFSSTERYPRQLREMDRATYVAMKREEIERQQTTQIQ